MFSESSSGTVTSFNVLVLPAISYLLICKPSGPASYVCAVSFVVLGAMLALSPMAYVIWYLDT